MHIRETFSRLRKGNLHGRVSNTGKSILKTGSNAVSYLIQFLVILAYLLKLK